MSPLEEMTSRWEVRPRGVLHLGAHVGQELPVYLAWGVPKVAWVEANSALLHELRKNVKDFQGHTVHEAAIWDRDGEVLPFFLASNGGSSSLLRMKLHSKRYPEVVESGILTVKTSSVDGLMTREKLAPADYDFLNMDIQGVEGLIIAGMKEQLKHLRWIYTEVNFEELYTGSWLFPDLYRVLERRGFGLAECRRTGEGWGEALFMRMSP